MTSYCWHALSQMCGKACLWDPTRSWAPDPESKSWCSIKYPHCKATSLTWRKRDKCSPKETATTAWVHWIPWQLFYVLRQPHIPCSSSLGCKSPICWWVSLDLCPCREKGYVKRQVGDRIGKQVSNDSSPPVSVTTHHALLVFQRMRNIGVDMKLSSYLLFLGHEFKIWDLLFIKDERWRLDQIFASEDLIQNTLVKCTEIVLSLKSWCRNRVIKSSSYHYPFMKAIVLREMNCVSEITRWRFSTYVWKK